MPLVPFEPFRHMDQWKKEMDKLFNEGIPSAFGFNQEFGSPRVDVYETDNEVVAHCEIAGLEKQDDVDIHIDNNMLTIQGHIQKSNEYKEDQMHRRERFTGRFQRTIGLPTQVKAEGTKASYKNGILEVRMPKAKDDQRKRIDIQFH